MSHVYLNVDRYDELLAAERELASAKAELARIRDEQQFNLEIGFRHAKRSGYMFKVRFITADRLSCDQTDVPISLQLGFPPPVIVRACGNSRFSVVTKSTDYLDPARSSVDRREYRLDRIDTRGIPVYLEHT